MDNGTALDRIAEGHEIASHLVSPTAILAPVSNWYKRHCEDMDAKALNTTDELQKTRFVEGLAAGMSQTMAAQDAGYTGRDLRTPGRLIPPEELRKRFQEIAARKGITLDRIGDKIAEHLEARANQTIEGKQVTQSEAPDYKVQQKAIDQLTDLIGMKDASRLAGGVSGITLSITGPAADRLTALLSGE